MCVFVYVYILSAALSISKSEFSIERTYMLCTVLDNPKKQYP
jgi:hypothetical protein